MKHRHLLPLKLGVEAGLLIGAFNASKILLAQRYIHFHLYNTAAQSMALQVDRWVLTSICFFYFFHLIFGLISRFNLMKKKHTALISTFFVSAFCVLYTFNAAQAANGDYAELSGTALILRFVYCAACIVGGLLFMKLLRHAPANTFASVTPRMMLAANRITHRFVCALFVPCLVVVLAVNATAAVLYIRAAHSIQKQPNIIFIMVDTLRADHLGCYGYPSDTSPNIDRFAKEAVRFNRAISQAPVTTWSVPSFMTSQYPQDIENITNIPLHLSDGQATLPELLKDYGYSTSAVISNPQVAKPSNFGQGYDHFDDSVNDLGESSPDVYRIASEQIKKLKDKRFFMFLLFMDPHSPYILHSQKPGDLSPVIAINNLDIVPSSARTRTLRRYYDSEIHFTDKYIGMLMQELKRQGLYDNSLIIFLADHGEEFGDHGHIFHGRSLYKEVLSVPLIMKLPNQRQGRVIKGTAQLLDVFPTIMRILGKNNPGLSLQGSAMDLDHLERLDDRPVFSAMRWNGADLRSATTEKYKYIVDETRNKEMLFDNMRDPREKGDISRKEPGLCNAMRQAIADRDEVGKTLDTHAAGGGKAPDLTEREKERLKTLGYLAH